MIPEGHQPDRPSKGGPSPGRSGVVPAVPEIGCGERSAIVHFADGSAVRVRYDLVEETEFGVTFKRAVVNPRDQKITWMCYASIGWIEWEVKEDG